MDMSNRVNRRIVTIPRPAQSPTRAEMPECVCGALRMATRAVTQVYDDAMRPSGLRVTQYGLMMRIERLQPVSAAALEGSLHADQTTLARALKVLENDGLIRRVPNPDKRVKRIALTAAGRKRLAHARRLWTEAQANMVGLIGDAAWKDTRRRLGKLLKATAER
jgi:DNA-binding MarR family transcriptional regulator